MSDPAIRLQQVRMCALMGIQNLRRTNTYLPGSAMAQAEGALWDVVHLIDKQEGR